MIWFQWEAARVVEAEGGLEELDPRVSAPLRSTRRFGSNGKQPVWWRPLVEAEGGLEGLNPPSRPGLQGPSESVKA